MRGLEALRFRDGAVAFVFLVGCAGLMTVVAGAEYRLVLACVSVVWLSLALTVLARIDGATYRIDPYWLLVLTAAGGLWQLEVLGPGLSEGLSRALVGAGVGFVIGAAPIAAAAAVGRRSPLYPGDALLFASLGVLVGAVGLLWVLALGVLGSVGRHFWIQRRRGRPWRRGNVALAPGMAAAAGVVFAVSNFSLVVGAGP